MSDQEMLSKLRDFANWVTTHPWQEIANRFEELLEKEKHENCGTPECCGKCDTTE
jgi:hypothetical protein